MIRLPRPVPHLCKGSVEQIPVSIIGEPYATWLDVTLARPFFHEACRISVCRIVAALALRLSVSPLCAPIGGSRADGADCKCNVPQVQAQCVKAVPFAVPLPQVAGVRLGFLDTPFPRVGNRRPPNAMARQAIYVFSLCDVCTLLPPRLTCRSLPTASLLPAALLRDSSLLAAVSSLQRKSSIWENGFVAYETVPISVDCVSRDPSYLIEGFIR